MKFPFSNEWNEWFGEPAPSAPRRKSRRRGTKRKKTVRPTLQSLERRLALSITSANVEAITATEGTAFSGAVATFSSSDNGPFNATIDWGDGNTTTVTESSISGGPSPATFTVNATNTYVDEGTATVKVTIGDTSDSTSLSATGSATVADADHLVAGTPVTATATAGSTFTGTVATFDNTGYADNPATDFSATIDWGDSTAPETVSGAAITKTGATLTVTGSHVYATAGAYAASVTLSDDPPGTATANVSAEFTVLAANTLSPEGSVSITATEGTTFTSTALAAFTASNASIPASDYTATVDWGDGTIDTSATGPVTVSTTGDGTLTVSGSHLYTDELAGAAASVVLTDNTSTASATVSGTADVADADILVPGTPVTATATAGSTFTGTVATFDNTGYADNPASDFSATIDWGDSTALETVSGSSITKTGATLTVTGSHVYATAGAYAATVTLNDDPPGTATANVSAEFTVLAAPANTLAPVGTVNITATEGTTYTNSALAIFSQTNASVPASDFTATVNWGDGNSSVSGPGSTISISTTGDGTLTVSGSHLYTDELAAADVSVVLVENASTVSATATGTATVEDADVLVPGTPITATATAGSTFTGTVATFDNTGYQANPSSDFTATINWGDGSTLDTVSGSAITNTNGTLTVTGSHLYATSGAKTVTVVLSDDAPGTATATASGTITALNHLAAVGTVSISATENTTFTSTALALFTQSDASVPATDFTAAVNWGDGHSSVSGPGSTISISTTGDGTLTVSGSHLYADELSGAAVSVILADNVSTVSATATGTATVDDADILGPGPSITATATAGATFTGTVATFINSGYQTNPASDFTATINWGDGTTVDTVSGSSITNTNGTLTVTGSHVYATAGPQSATVTIRDIEPGTANATATATFTVLAAPANTLAAVGTVTISATENTTFTSTSLAVFTQTNTSVPASDFTATVNWGDGTSTTSGAGSSITITGSGATLTVSGSHLYTDELAGAPVTVILSENASTISATATGTATVADADSLTAGTPVTATATAGTTFTGTVATFTNSGYPSNPASDFSATIDWGDGTSLVTVSGSSITNTNGTLTVTGSHVYASAGTQSAIITLRDDAPGTASATATAAFTVLAAPANTLSAVGTVSISATEGTAYTNTALATFTQTNTSVPASSFTATINWGDGQSSTGTVSGTGTTLTVSGSHLYADELSGASVSVVLTENGSTISATATGTATVADADVLAPGAAVTASATAGSTFSGTVATFTNSGYQNNPASDFTATIDWGDGTTPDTVTGSAITNTNGTLTVTGSHVYTSAGTKTATVTLRDDPPGTASATSTATITVASAANTVSPVGTVSISATVGTTFSSSALATFTETDATVPASSFTATINWGDGTSSTGTVSGSGGTFTVAGSHLYSATLSAAPVSVVLTQNAPGTATATATGTANVSAAAPSTSGYLAGQAGDGTNQTFLTNLYRELLGRAPDSAGQTGWMNVLGTTPASADVRATVIRGFLYSPEYRQHFVTEAYQTLLGRAPDPDGLQYFEGVLAGYQNFTLVIEWISASDEYFAHNGGTNASFITAIYRDLLGRAEDPAAAPWVNVLNAGQMSRDQVVRYILFSQEGLQKLFNGNFSSSTGGTPNAPAGSPQTGSYALATLTGNGISNLYFQGNLNQPAIDNAVNFLHVTGSNSINGNQVNTTQMLVNYLSTPQYFG